MKRLLLIIIILLLSVSLSGCSKKDMMLEPSIELSNYNKNHNWITINNNEVHKIDDFQTLSFVLYSDWKYSVHSFMTDPKLSKIEFQKPNFLYSIYLDEKLVEDNHPLIKDVFEEQRYSINKSFFTIDASISSFSHDYIRLPGKGSYLIIVEFNIKLDGVIKNYSSKLKFKLI